MHLQDFGGGKDVSFFQFSFFGVYFSFSFSNLKNEGRVLGIQVAIFMSICDKGLFDILFMFKELGKNLIHFISKLLDFSSSRYKGYPVVSFEF